MSVLPDDWPPEVSFKQYTNLALIRNDNQSRTSKKMPTMEYDYIHGKVDNIVACKESIELNEVFFPLIDKETNESRLTILMEGAPGVGKTTVTRKLCTEWAKGEMLQEYHLVILIPLRERNLDEQAEIKELFPGKLAEEEIVSYYIKTFGRRILFIFDGYDEVHESCKLETSLLLQIVLGKDLENCSVLVTSRPHASGYLKHHSRFNRHVEVLGFSTERIKQCIQQNLPDADHAHRLIKMLKDRLDIVSLCYIPLNCRIVLFVFKHLNFDLPNTLTELYKTFILNTVKHHAEREEFHSDRKEKIRRAKDLHRLPDNLTKKLHALCKLAYDGIKEGKLSFNDDELEGELLQSLGLLNSHQSITSINVERQFQFLHLTIQEFLSAMYLASNSLSSKDKVAFFHEHINDKRFRMSLLFLAGLTKLKFYESIYPAVDMLTSNLVLGECSTNYYDLNVVNSNFLLCAHCVYEAELDSGSKAILKIFPIQFNVIDLNQSLSPFEALTVAHYLSSTPVDHIWDRIDFSKCHLPEDSVLYKIPHKTKHEQLSITLTKSLTLGIVQITMIYPYVKALQELTFVIKPSTASHTDLVTLCAQLNHTKTVLRTLKIYCESSASCICISKKEILWSLKKPLLCSCIFNELLNFVDYQQVREISIEMQFTAFTNCDVCNFQISDTLSSLCKLLKESPAIEKLDFSDCELSPKMVDQLVTVIRSNKHLKLKTLGLRQSFLDSVKLLSTLLASGITSITVGQFEFKVEDQTLKLCGNKQVKFEEYSVVLTTFNVPQNLIFVDVEIRVQNIFSQNLYQFMDNIGSFLSGNSPIRELSLSTTESISHKHPVTIYKLFDALSNLPFQFKRFSCSDLTLTRKSLFPVRQTNIYADTLVKALNFLTEIESLSICSPVAFHRNHSMSFNVSFSPIEETIQTLCNLLKRSNQVIFIDLSHCKLEAEVVNHIVRSLPIKASRIILHGNSVSKIAVNTFLCKSLKNLFTNELGSLQLGVYGFLLTFNKSPQNLQVSEEPTVKMHVDKLFKCLWLPDRVSSLKLDLKCKYDQLFAVRTLLENNPKMIQLILLGVDFNHCSHERDFRAMINTIVEHSAIKEISFIKRSSGEERIISQVKLWLPYVFRDKNHSGRLEDSNSEHLKLCSKTFMKLLSFLKDVKIINISWQTWAFHYCQTCKTTKKATFTSFCDFLAESNHLQYLDLSWCDLSKDLVEEVLSAVSNKFQLELLWISGSNCNKSVFNKILELMFKYKLKHLRLSNFEIQFQNGVLSFVVNEVDISDQSLYLSSLLKYCVNSHAVININDFELVGVHITRTDQDQLSLLLSPNSSIWSLTVKKCTFSTVLLEILPLNRVLKYLDLSSCNSTLTVLEQTQLLKTLLMETSTLISLNLSNCETSEAGIEILASGLQANATLQHLIINSLHLVIKERTKAQLWTELLSSLKQHKTIQTLSVTNNEFDVTLVMDLIRCNQVISCLECEGCGFPETHVKELLDELSQRLSV